MMDPSIQLSPTLSDVGVLLFPDETVPLNALEWKVLETLVRNSQYEHVIGGDADEAHSVQVARYVNDVDKPRSMSPLSEDIQRIVMSDKMLYFYSRFTGTDRLCLRRCQSNRLITGDFIGLHKDQDSNPDYLATVVFHFDSVYLGGDFVSHHPVSGARRFHPSARTVLVNDCELEHQVTPVEQGERLTLACFLSTKFGPSPLPRRDFRLSH